MSRKTLTLGAITTLLGSVTLAGFYAAEHYSAPARAEAMLEASVSIKTIGHVTIDTIGDSVWEAGAGSGFLVSRENCEIWTNYHVIRDAALIEVFPRSWESARGIPATVVNYSPRTDLAVLQMDRCEGIEEAKLADSNAVRVGAETYAVGNPHGLSDSMSRGIISHAARYVNGATPYLQTDAAINPGNSGGALFNHRGEVIGINTGIGTHSSWNVGIGYAIPINVAKSVVQQLLNGPPSWGDAGLGDMVSSLTPEEAELFRVPIGHGGMIVTATPNEGPGAGKLFVRDVIFKIDRTAISSAEQAMRLITSHQPGDKLRFELVRHGERKAIDITLTDGWQDSKQPRADPYEGHLGMTLEMWGDEDDEPEQFGSPVITHVQSLGPAHRARIASSQRSLRPQGPFLAPYVLDVKTVTGVVYKGEYYELADIATLDRLASEAFAAGDPMLLEIEYWARVNPRHPQQPLKHVRTSFFKLRPALAPDAVQPSLHEATAMAKAAADNTTLRSGI
ncbi:MAG: S1C family serine protease [Gammaproteobacteria bacterium]